MNARSNACWARERSARVSLSILVATTPIGTDKAASQSWARRSLASPGCRPSIRSSTAKAEGARRSSQAEFEAIVSVVFERAPAALLLVDARHPGLANDRAAWQWVHAAAGDAAVVATKIDKLGRGERIRALRDLESVFETSVLPVSAVTGEGLDQLWTLINRLKKSG